MRGAPPVSSRVYLSAPAGTRDLISGGPDPALLPSLPARPAARPARMYAQVPVLPRLRELAADQFAADGIDATSLMVTGGALDGIERVLATWLMPSDRVIVEDPGHAVTFDLVAAMGYTAVPVPVDDLGIRPAELAAALAQGAGALIVTPRAQAATGAAWNQDRAAAISTVLRRYPALGVIEDDHAGPVAGVPAFSAGGGAGGRERWVTIRSVSKSLGPDLRLAVMAGDEATIARVAGRQALGTGWVSYQLQELVADLWADPAVARALRTAAGVYARRGDALRSALRERGITASGRSGFTCWVPVSDEDGVASRWSRRAGRWPPGSGSASPRRRASGSRSPAWRRTMPPCSRPTSPARCGTGPPAWTEPGSVPRAEHAELVALGIGHDHPADLLRVLADVDAAGAEHLQAAHLALLIRVRRQIDVQPVLHRLALRTGQRAVPRPVGACGSTLFGRREAVAASFPVRTALGRATVPYLRRPAHGR